MKRFIDAQAALMEELGQSINPQPGLTSETREWEDQVKQHFYHLQMAQTRLHQTMSADAVALVLLESVTMMQNIIGLLTNIGVGDKIEPAFTQVIEAKLSGGPRPNLLPLVLDRR